MPKKLSKILEQMVETAIANKAMEKEDWNFALKEWSKLKEKGE